MGFRKQQRKKHEEISAIDKSKTRKHRYITYELSSFFLNLSTRAMYLQQCEKDKEREKINDKNNSYHS